MAFLSPLLFLGSYLLLQQGPYLVQAKMHDGSLTISSGESLVINTSTGRAEHLNRKEYQLHFLHFSYKQWNYSVAQLAFKKDISFVKGSIVRLAGSNALSIKSEKGNILTQTVINVTCTTLGRENETCLGGYTVSASATENIFGRMIYTGSGPGGWHSDIESLSPILNSNCMPSASHGGRGSVTTKLSADSYGRQENNTLGGSGGTCLAYRGRAAGGGAVELLAENGSITIDGSINANAQNVSLDCSGGSGGLIRLKARKVKIEPDATLSVDGASPFCKQFQCYGGAGGVIQIIASCGVIFNGSRLMLNKGTKICASGSASENSQNGFLLIKEPINGTIYRYENDIAEFNETFSWGQQAQCATFQSVTPSKTFNATPTIAADVSTKIPIIAQSSHTTSAASTTTNTLSASVTVALSSKSLLQKIEYLTANEANNTIFTSSAILAIFREFKNEFKTISAASLDDNLKVLKVIKTLTGLVAKRIPRILQNVWNDVLDVADEILKERNEETWQNTEKMPEFLELLDNVLLSAIPSVLSEQTGSYRKFMENVAVEAVRYDQTVNKDITLPTDAERATFARDDQVVLSAGALEGLQGGFTFLVILFRVPGKKAVIGSQQSNMKVASSSVMSCSLLDSNNSAVTLNDSAHIYFELKEGCSQIQKNCSYWDANARSWSQEGVKNEKMNETHAQCNTTHFTNFAVLIVGVSKVGKNSLALSIISYIGTAISVVGLSVTLIVYLSIEVLNSERLKIHANLSLALLCGHIAFLSGIKATDNKDLCKAIAVILHYFFLTAFNWMLIEGVHLYIKVIKVYGSENINMRAYYVFGWVFSAIVVGISAGIKPDNYGTVELCWLSTKDGLIWAFVGPVILFSAINMAILIIVTKTVMFSASGVTTPDKANIKAAAKCVGVLMPILGFGWIFGLFAFQTEASIVFQYLFAITNSIQGLFIFLFFCVFNNEVRAAFKRRQEKHSLTKSIGYANDQSITLSANPGMKSETKMTSLDKPSSHLEKLKKRIAIKPPRASTVVHVKIQPTKTNDDVNDSPLSVSRIFRGQDEKKKTEQEARLNSPGAID